MKAIVNSKELLGVLTDMSYAYNPNCIVQIMTYAKLDFRDAILTVSVGDFGLTMTKEMRADFKEEFTVLIQYDELKRICTAVSDGPLFIDSTEKQVILTFDKDVFKMGKPEDIKNYPGLPVIEEMIKIYAPVDFFWGVATAAALTVPESEFYRNVCLSIKQGTIEAVATNGAEIFVNKVPVNGQTGQARITIDKSLAVTAKSIMEDGVIIISEKNVCFCSAGTNIIGKRTEDTYIGYEYVIDKKESANCSLLKADIENAISKATAIKSTLKIHDIYLRFTPGKIEVEFTDQDRQAKAELPAIHDLSMDICFNAIALKKAIADLPPGCKNIDMCVINPRTVIFMQDADNDQATIVMTPIAPPNQ